MARQFSPSRLRQARLDAGLSRTQLAAAIDRAGCQVAGYEQGRYRPNLDALTALSAVLNRPIDDFFAAAEHQGSGVVASAA